MEKLDCFVTAQFPTAKLLSKPYTAFLSGNLTFIVGKLSELEQLRDKVREDNDLPRPIVPILIMDCQIPEACPNKWLSLNSDGLYLMKGQIVLGRANPKDVPGYVPTSYVVKEGCVACAFGINPCPFHLEI